MEYSRTYGAAIAGLLALLLRSSGLEVKDEELLVVVTNLIQVASFVVIMWERYKRGGVHLSGFKKK
jgi:hypothetical protein